MNFYYLNYHYSHVSVHARVPPLLLFGEGDAANPAPAPRALTDLVRDVANREVLFVTHGFNVDYGAGLRSIGRFVNRLTLPDQTIAIGVLWPGDFYPPFGGINYPWSPTAAIDAGQHLGSLCKGVLATAASFSFVSHSLGARVILEAAQCFENIKLLCVTAGAINDDCLSDQYEYAAEHSENVRVLASTRDWVLKFLYRVGDPVSEALDYLPGHLGRADHRPFRAALGRFGPNPPLPPRVHSTEIPDADDYGHGNYLAPSTEVYHAPASGTPLTNDNRWFQVADFVSSALRETDPDWSTAATPAGGLRRWDWAFHHSFWPL